MARGGCGQRGGDPCVRCLCVPRGPAPPAGPAPRPPPLPSFLRADCKAGKGRTGTAIAAALVHNGACATADEALALFAELEKEGRSNAADSEEKARIQVSLAEAGKKK